MRIRWLNETAFNDRSIQCSLQKVTLPAQSGSQRLSELVLFRHYVSVSQD